MGDATDDSRLHALREAGTVATLSTVDREREETFLVLEVFWEVVASVEIGVPLTLVDTFNVEEDFLLVEVVFLVEEEDFLLVEVAFEVTVVFFVEEDALTVKVTLIVEVARLVWEEEA